MDTLESLRRQQDLAESLHSVVRTMKILSLTSIHQYEDAVASVGDYYRTVRLGLQIALRNAPDAFQIARATPSPHVGAVVFGASRGMSGRFNEQIASHVSEQIETSGDTSRTILALGEYIGDALDSERLVVERTLPMPDSIKAIVGHVQQLLLLIEEWRTGDVVDRVVLFHNRPSSRASFDPSQHQLLPLDPQWLQSMQSRKRKTNVLPTFTVEWKELFTSLLREYFFVSIYRAYAESLAAEHAGRLAAMQVAEDNVENMLQQLEKDFNQTRQKMITEELLDIVSGFEALEQEGQ